MKKLLICFLVSIFIVGFAEAQTNLVLEKGDFKKPDDKEGFKEAWNEITKGEEFYDMGGGALIHARRTYLAAYDYNKQYAPLNYKIGICYLKTDDKSQAIKFLLSAYELMPNITDDILFFLGKAYHVNNEFAEAKGYYTKFKGELSSEGAEKLNIDVDMLIAQCELGIQLKASALNVKFENLGTVVNSEYDEYGQAVSKNDSVMFYTSKREHVPDAKVQIENYRFYEGVYTALKENGNWSSSERFLKGGDQRSHLAISGASYLGDTVYLYIGKESKGDIYQSIKKKSKHGGAKPIKGYVNTKVQEGSVALTSDASKLYFVSEIEDESAGGSDIYVSENKKGKWQKPENIGFHVNSEYDVRGLAISADNSTLFFSTEGPGSIGGYDIFYTVKDESGNWSDPVNMGYPINSGGNEYSFSPTEDPNLSYISAIREGGVGGSDIYKVVNLGVKMEYILDEARMPLTGSPDLQKDIFSEQMELLEGDGDLLSDASLDDVSDEEDIVEEENSSDVSNKMAANINGARSYGAEDEIETTTDEISADIEAEAIGVERRSSNSGTDYLFTGSLVDRASGEPVKGTIQILNAVTKQAITKVTTQSDGTFEISLQNGNAYGVKIMAQGFMPDDDRIDFTDNNKVESNYRLEKIALGRSRILNNIYFSFATAKLRKKSYTELENVHGFLVENPSTNIRIQGYTDNIGSYRANILLSNLRVKACVNYLIDKGIDPERLEYKGYGFLFPIAGNHTTEGRQMNRRVEFKVIE